MEECVERAISGLAMERTTYDYGLNEESYRQEVDRLTEIASNSGSTPIEQFMAVALNKLFEPQFGVFDVTSQYTVSTARGNFRPNFVVDYHPTGDIEVSVAVECDGQRWHDQSPLQVAKDKTRDRALAVSGFAVICFGSLEIFADADACAQEVKETLITMARAAERNALTWRRRMRTASS